MPRGSEGDRSNQLQAIAAVCHQLISDPQIRDWLDAAESAQDTLTKEDRRNLFLMRRQWIESNALPANLVKEIARLEMEGDALHTELKPTGDWSRMRDWYAHNFDIAREKADAKRAAMPGQFASRYEALLDSFSPGMREATVDRAFARLEQTLPALLREARERQAAQPAALPLVGPFDGAQQEELCHRVLTAMNFDFSRGRFDICPAHPSAGGTADDARITAQPNENDFLPSLYGAIHEGGHALYDQNRPMAWRYQPAGEHLGMGLHESQSRIMEVVAGHTPEFLGWLETQARALFERPDDPALSAENLGRLLNRTESGFIRIEASEPTYSAHVILRYRLERALVNGEMSIDDLPAAWNDGMTKILGLTPPNPSKGHMQDVHWACGLVGYFPAYTLGDIGAAQFYAAACRARPEIPAALARGDFGPLNAWLNDNVRGKGSLLTPEELFIAATGEDLNVDHYLDHLSRRYLGRAWRQF